MVAKGLAFIILELSYWAYCAIHLSSKLLKGAWQAVGAVQLAWLVLVLARGAAKLDAILGIVAWLREVLAC